MKIALDARALVSLEPTGKEICIINVLDELFKSDKKNHYFLYLNRDFSRVLPSNFSKKIIKAPGIFWHFFVLLDLLFHKFDVFFSPLSFIIPALNFSSSNVIIVYDLFVFSSIKKSVKLKTKLIENFFIRLALKNSQKIITISQNTKKDLIKIFRVRENKIVIIDLGVHSKYCIIENKKRIQLFLDRYNLPEKFILFVGTLKPRKNIKRLIQAYNIASTHFPLVIVGKRGWFYQEVFNEVRDLKIEDKVIFLNYLPAEDLPCLYNKAICFVYPSLYEGFGLPPLEAMACGCPVITSNISSLPEVVGDAAILVNPYKVDEIAVALKKILTNEILRQELRKRGLVQAQKFSWGKTSEQILKILYFEKI